jgi:hypothetical protein
MGGRPNGRLLGMSREGPLTHSLHVTAGDLNTLKLKLSSWQTGPV